MFGTCSECGPGSGYGSLTLEEIFNDHIKPLSVPAWQGAMIGHRHAAVHARGRARSRDRCGGVQDQDVRTGGYLKSRLYPRREPVQTPVVNPRDLNPVIKR